MPTLLTGASGFVGAAVLRHLVDAGHDVRVLLRPQSDRRNLEGVKCDVVTGDLADPASLDAAVKGCKAVFHVAADYRLWVTDPAAMYRANVDGTRTLLVAASMAGADRIVYTSSVATLGILPGDAVSDEETPSTLDDMIGHYKRSKFLAEEEVRRLATEHGAPVVIVNPSAPFGPRDIKPTPTGDLVVRAAAGKMPAYIDTGLNVAHVDDVARGHLLAFERGVVGERYILGGDNLPLRDILDIVCRHAGRRAPTVKLPHGPLIPVAYAAEALTRLFGGGEPVVTRDALRMARKRMYFSSDKARRMLGYDPRPAADALKDAADWFRAHGYWG